MKQPYSGWPDQFKMYHHMHYSFLYRTFLHYIKKSMSIRNVCRDKKVVVYETKHAITLSSSELQNRLLEVTIEEGTKYGRQYGPLRYADCLSIIIFANLRECEPGVYIQH